MLMCVCTGDIEREMDPFFPFEEAVDVWARTFAALGIQYKGATMRLDLCDRAGKYSNGFCHWPQPAWRKVSPLTTPQVELLFTAALVQVCSTPKRCMPQALLLAWAHTSGRGQLGWYIVCPLLLPCSQHANL